MINKPTSIRLSSSISNILQVKSGSPIPWREPRRIGMLWGGILAQLPLLCRGYDFFLESGSSFVTQQAPRRADRALLSKQPNSNAAPDMPSCSDPNTPKHESDALSLLKFIFGLFPFLTIKSNWHD
ncbi:hypothetical protein PGTUg99_036581 [Puccinia graminis f. sp. tritici]|uniref:Uncharacterized protein n=1 Tax=Puccinia graminis f. sp. tritici TaxID=56615 RepID=A0A5B0RB73_PUCGR|nr:hypothetical protein PGTUg99_036581 [Puccinia graminis f. sp. tritici]